MGALVLGLSTGQKGLGAWINQYVLWLACQHQPLQTAAGLNATYACPGKGARPTSITRYQTSCLAPCEWSQPRPTAADIA